MINLKSLHKGLLAICMIWATALSAASSSITRPPGDFDGRQASAATKDLRLSVILASLDYELESLADGVYHKADIAKKIDFKNPERLRMLIDLFWSQYQAGRSLDRFLCASKNLIENTIKSLIRYKINARYHFLMSFLEQIYKMNLYGCHSDFCTRVDGGDFSPEAKVTFNEKYSHQRDKVLFFKYKQESDRVMKVFAKNYTVEKLCKHFRVCNKAPLSDEYIVLCNIMTLLQNARLEVDINWIHEPK
jgi:hypothetical protein